jgi:hypothetical protein
MRTTDAYQKWVKWSDEDGVYLGKCPDLITGIHGDYPVKLYERQGPPAHTPFPWVAGGTVARNPVGISLSRP